MLVVISSRRKRFVYTVRHIVTSVRDWYLEPQVVTITTLKAGESGLSCL